MTELVDAFGRPLRDARHVRYLLALRRRLNAAPLRRAGRPTHFADFGSVVDREYLQTLDAVCSVPGAPSAAQEGVSPLRAAGALWLRMRAFEDA